MRATLLRVFAIAVAVNYAWEMGQAYLYEPMGSLWEATRRCLIASLVDGVLVLVVVAAGQLVFRSSGWYTAASAARYVFAAACGLTLAVAVEWWGLETGRWVYTARMPRLPGIDLGLVPLVQLPLMAPLTLWLARPWVPSRTTK